MRYTFTAIEVRDEMTGQVFMVPANKFSFREVHQATYEYPVREVEYSFEDEDGQEHEMIGPETIPV